MTAIAIEPRIARTAEDGHQSVAGSRVAYLVNQYPYPSGTFIRREIDALEQLGTEVFRFSIRQPNAKLHEPKDLIESSRTKVLLNFGAVGLLDALVQTGLRRPRALFGAMLLACRVGWNSDRGLLRNLIYLLEACQLLRWVEQENIPHVHAHYGTNSTTVAMLCHAMGGPSYSFTSHGPHEFDKPELLHLGEKVARSKFAVAISEYCRSQLYRWTAHRDWHKIHVVHCGLDRDYFHRAPARHLRRRNCCSSDAWPNKKVHTCWSKQREISTTGASNLKFHSSATVQCDPNWKS